MKVCNGSGISAHERLGVGSDWGQARNRNKYWDVLPLDI